MRRLPFLLLALIFAGCEDDVAATVDLDLPFSMYGFLDPTADQQVIRVIPITDRIDSDAALEAVVTSTDLGTGEVATWRDSTVTYADGSTGTVFVSDTTPAPGARIRLEAVRPDGDASTIEVTIPPIVTPTVGVAEFSLGEVTYPIRFDGVPRVLNGQLRLAVGGGNDDAPTVLRIPIDVQPREIEPGVWIVRVPFVSAVFRALNEQGLANTGLRLLSAQYVGFAANAEWDPPSGDPAALAEPGVFTNVQGGLGFVGAGYFTIAQWTPSPAVQVSAGFTTDRETASFAALNEVSLDPTPQLEFYNPLFSTIELGGYSISDDSQQPRKQTFEFGVRVPPQGYFVVPIEFDVEPGTTIIGLFNRAGDQIGRLFVGTIRPGQSYGSYPDGLSLRLPSGGPDVFQGALRPTLGGANDIHLRPAFINEILTAGTSGFLEGVALEGFNVTSLEAMSDPEAFFDAVRLQGPSFPVATETAGALDLPQAGGTVYLVARFFDPTLGPEGGNDYRVVDTRTYDGQVPGQSSGYLPDAPDGTWTRGLRPTRGAANANGRQAM
ncbi:hypothetical protein [Rubrivirga sp.]|uniref:hypothetical protein n=1 Tax=Rubrivirga sp. TaxID=1885344 RepID=UPI003C7262A5